MIQTHLGDGYSRERLAQIQRRRLKALVGFARKDSPFYADLYRSIGEDFRLNDLPPVAKPELMAGFDRVMTDRRVTMKRVDAFCEDLENVGRMLDGKYLVFREYQSRKKAIIPALTAALEAAGPAK